MKQLLIFTFILLLGSCNIPTEDENFTTEGLRPVYRTFLELGDVGSDEAREFGKLGKIVAFNEFIFIGERFEGIHVVDNSDPTNPQNVHFWKIPGNIDFTLKGNFLYAENSHDLLVLDISNPAAIQLVSKIEDIYQEPNGELFPSNYFGFFECVDINKGIVVDWEEAILVNPECRI